MSEEILKALVQLYAIITKQDGGVTDKEREFVIHSFKRKLSHDLVVKYSDLYDELVGDNRSTPDNAERKASLTSVRDSVKTLGICRKINKTLSYKQKIVALIELLELIRSDGNFTPQRVQIIDTVASEFNIPAVEYKQIERFILQFTMDDLADDNLLIVDENEIVDDAHGAQHIQATHLHGSIQFLKVPSADMIFAKYSGTDTASLNGYVMESGAVVLFSQGSILKLAKGECFYYSDIQSSFIKDSNKVTLSFNVSGLGFKFQNQKIGLRDINISEEAGRLIGIMGASGAGKTTLLNVLAGLEEPSVGTVKINGVNVHENMNRVKGMMGYIAQDDLLIEELTVFENLYFNAQLCFKGRSKQEITALVEKLLSDLGLFHIKDLPVGNPLNKKISGGQRKRLNIALELIREPAVLFVDEPTSGLSSRDSENVMDLLKELSKKGALIFVVIHQPSSDIYKIFDKMLILDTGGYLIFNGNPVEAVSYFKQLSNQIDAANGQCPKCGNVNPEQIFNIIEEKVVDELGNYTPNRKVSPEEWYNFSLVHQKAVLKEDFTHVPIKQFSTPSRIKQFLVYTFRDLKSKFNNKQYLLVNLFEAPLLAFILAIIVRYNNTPDGKSYVYRYNDNIPAYLLMCIVVSLFIGLSLSADEIIKDRKIVRRESFLNLSRFSYLCSKISILFFFSAIQMFLFVWIGNSILGIQDMTLSYWLVLFTCACMSNVLGLLVSSGFESAVTVYILIPLLLIPQMILSGAMLSFDKINDWFGNDEKVPIVADLMASRWAFEALAVKQFKDNQYQRLFYDYDHVEAVANYNMVYVIPVLRDKITRMRESSTGIQTFKADLLLVKNELQLRKKLLGMSTADSIERLCGANDAYKNLPVMDRLVKQLEDKYHEIYNNASEHKEQLLFKLEMDKPTLFAAMRDKYYNESLEDLLRNKKAAKKYVMTETSIIPKTDPVYFNPDKLPGDWSYRTHFFSPTKQIAGKYFDTFFFNICFVWSLSILMFVVLYLDIFRKLMDFKFSSFVFKTKTA
ncbi:MAG: transporter related protein [Chitinophagaceae bacterium]|nr:transporter related protein [Chitinophagaceae bacterium]